MVEPAVPSGPRAAEAVRDPAPASSSSPAAEPAPPREAPAAPPPPPGGATAGAAMDRRVHVYEAAAHQRERVLSSFDTQRAAILKAVADQRMAALAPIMSVQAKMANGSASAAAPAGQDARSPPNPAATNALGAGARLAGLTPQQLVAADIVAAFRAMIADEVRSQLNARFPSASPEVAQPPPTRGREPGLDAASGAAQPAVGTALKATLKVMVAAEVAAQLDALIRTAAGTS